MVFTNSADREVEHTVMAGVKLGVNIDHVATVRQARGTEYPSVLKAAALCEDAGADGITIHLREDRRHIQDADVWDLRKAVRTRLNLEMALSDEILDVACSVHPDEVCLVPEQREELTTEGGLDVAGQRDRVSSAVSRLMGAGITVSLFVDPDSAQIVAAAACGAPTIELHTGACCAAVAAEAEAERCQLVTSARQAHTLGLVVNAGHGINLENVDRILTMPHLDTLNIGHSIVARAIMIGLRGAVAEMRDALHGYAGGEPA
jgi:pyridoxine 5-phosphate synthase